MKLYDVNNLSFIRVIEQISDDGKSTTDDIQTPIASPDIKVGDILFFDHIDGMYSLCQKVDKASLKPINICHPAAWTDVELVDLEEIMTFEQIRDFIGRSGYGKDGTGKFRKSSLANMNDEWVQNSITFVGENHPHCKYYKKELEYRKQHGISIPDTDQ